MLEPDTRELLLDLLRPPYGATLDRAVGTTFTLDLSALLVAPLAFAMFDWAVEDDGTPDPIAMLEALRRYAGRTTVFHQAGMIALPSWQPLLVHLEQCVVPVTPPNPTCRSCSVSKIASTVPSATASQIQLARREIMRSLSPM